MEGFIVFGFLIVGVLLGMWFQWSGEQWGKKQSAKIIEGEYH